MEHFIAYHSAERMGYRYESSKDLNFLSTKKGLLDKALGNFVWCIEGVLRGKGTEYFLCGVFLADKVEEEAIDLFSIHGPLIVEFSPPLPLNHYEWFKSLRQSQGNFGLGFNRINLDAVITSLEGLLVPENEGNYFLDWDNFQEVDRSMATSEGVCTLTSHHTRKRNYLLVKAKKIKMLKEKGGLACETCGFDFYQFYGSIGKEFCEVHHLRPLAEYDDQGEVSTLNDLAVLCSNCHRMIHRSNPMLSIDQLATLILQRPN